MKKYLGRKQHFKKWSDKMERRDTIGYQIRLSHNQIHKIMEAKRTENEHDLALTGMQRWTIGFLKEHEGEEVYQKDIEAAFQVSRATASNMLSVMERKGLVERLPVEHDARLKRLVLTERGSAIIERVNADVREVENLLVAGLTEEEILAFKQTLTKVLANLGVDMEEGTRYCSDKDKNRK